MNSIGTLRLKTGKYVYNISYKKKAGLPAPNFTSFKKYDIKVRKPTTVYYDYRDSIFKEVVYPQNLWYSVVYTEDELEKNINEYIEFIPDWIKIEIENEN